MPAKQYTEFMRQTDDSWAEQQPATVATQISDVLQTVEFNLKTGFSTFSGRANEIIYNAIEKSCTFSLAIQGNIPYGSTVVAAIPEGYRPKKTYTFVAVSGTGKSFQVRIAANGEVSTWHSGEALLDNFFCSGTFYLIE